MDVGARIIGWFNQYWPGQVSEAGDGAGRSDFTELLNCYVADREIRMFPGTKCVGDFSDPEPGNDGFLAFVRDSRRPVAAATSASYALRERLTADYNPVSATLRDQLVYSPPTHLWSFHRVRDRHVILGEVGARIEPIISGSGFTAKVKSWTVGFTAFNPTFTVQSGTTTSVIRVPLNTAHAWMVGLGIAMLDGPAVGQSSEIQSVNTAAGPTYDEVTLVTPFSAAPVAGNTFNMRNDFTKKLGAFTFDPDPGNLTLAANQNRANSLRTGDVMYIGEVDTADPDASVLRLRGHYVVDVTWDGSAIVVILATHLTASSISSSMTLDCGRIRGPAGGIDAFGVGGGSPPSLDFMQEPEALAAFWIEDEFDIDAAPVRCRILLASIDAAPVRKIYASYVANRQRDYGDQSPDSVDARTGMNRFVEGHRPGYFGTNAKWGITRRPGKSLPYRGVPQVAGDRILIAAPGYGCMFQVPAVIPSTSSLSSSPSRGAVEGYNEANIRPRSLGVPKGMLSVPTSSRGWPLVTGRANTTGFSLGTYVFAVAYRDDATGEIGQLSEPWNVDVTEAYGAFNGEADDQGGAFPHSTTTITVDFGVYTTSALNGFRVRFTTGALAGQIQTIVSNTNTPSTHGTITVSVAFSGAPVNGDDFEIVTDPANGSVNLNMLIMHPGYALAETLALSCMIYMSKVGETALHHIATIQLGDAITTYSGSYVAGSSASSVYGLPVTDGANASPETANLLYLYTLPIALNSTPALYNTDVELPEQRQMPRGASWVAVVRGVPISGGSIGNTGDKGELSSGTASSLYDQLKSVEPDEVTIRRMTADNLAIDSWSIVANRTIPSSYAGSYLWSLTLFPYPMEIAILDRVRNCRTLSPNVATEIERQWQRWGIVENPHRWDQIRSVETQPAYLVLPLGQIQIHEPGLPSVSLALGKREIDANKDSDSVAGGEFRGTALFFTQRHTYAMAWDHGPAGAVPILVSSEFGCNAPNAVAEHDGGTAWLCERGIVDYDGAPSWGGRRIEHWFRGDTARFLRDSTGMMRQSFAFWDETRSFMVFGLTENREGALEDVDYIDSVGWDSASDGMKSRFPCDTMLIYNARLRALSEWHPPSGLEALWVDAVSCADGIQRMAYLAADNRLRVFDEHFGDENQEPLIVPVLSSGASATIPVTGALGSAYSNRSTGTYVRAGMDVIVYDPATFTIRARTTAVSAATNQIVVADTVAFRAGDKVLIGAKSMTMTTASMRPGDGGGLHVSAVNLALRLTSRITEGRAGAVQQPCWAKAWLIYPEHASGLGGGGAELLREPAAHRAVNGDFCGYSTTRDIVRTVRLDGARITATSVQIKVELFGGSHVAVQDLRFETSTAEE